ncbi:hypothetical protein KSP40_PGU018096 [Platanthera guangdongensis]|uniref:Succinate dehydrogenase subunit 3 n=1 Tax=Platanthera guangdongensis TaxID=2320717 RepID=A0ABR2MUN6_9ASPA
MSSLLRRHRMPGSFRRSRTPLLPLLTAMPPLILREPVTTLLPLISDRKEKGSRFGEGQSMEEMTSLRWKWEAPFTGRLYQSRPKLHRKLHLRDYLPHRKNLKAIPNTPLRIITAIGMVAAGSPMPAVAPFIGALPFQHFPCPMIFFPDVNMFLSCIVHQHVNKTIDLSVQCFWCHFQILYLKAIIFFTRKYCFDVITVIEHIMNILYTFFGCYTCKKYSHAWVRLSDMGTNIHGLQISI